MKPDMTTTCPHCGEEIKRNAKACPHCGSDDQTGWSEQTYLDGIDLPDGDSYEEIRRSEFGSASGRQIKKRVWIYMTALVILALFLLGLVMNFR